MSKGNNKPFPIRYPIVKDPDILGGIPVIEGTRVPARLLSDLLNRGYPEKIIISEYPSLDLRKIKAFISLMGESLNASFQTI